MYVYIWEYSGMYGMLQLLKFVDEAVTLGSHYT